MCDRLVAFLPSHVPELGTQRLRSALPLLCPSSFNCSFHSFPSSPQPHPCDQTSIPMIVFSFLFAFPCDRARAVPAGTLVVGTYNNLDHHLLESTPTQFARNGEAPRMLVTMLDPQGLTLASHHCQKEGKFSFTSQVGGEHLICLRSDPPTRLGRDFRFSFEVEAGDKAIDYANVSCGRPPPHSDSCSSYFASCSRSLFFIRFR